VLAVPAPASSPAQPGGDAAVAAERAAQQSELDRRTERERQVRYAVDQAVQRNAALTSESRSISRQQAKIVAEQKAAAAAKKTRTAKARAQERAEAKAEAKARAKAEAESQARAEAAREAEADRVREEAARALEAAARARAAAEAAEQARRERVKAQGYEPGTTDPREIARQILQNRFGYGADQFTCFNDIIIRESNWDIDATNPSSGAYGIPQALPGSKMASVGSDWRTNPATQIIWAVGYMDDRYGSICEAWDFKRANGWY
jgi:hypothetical protein